MSSGDARWETYEDVARYLLNEFAQHFGLGHVEGKQLVSGASGTDWEIEAKAVLADGSGFLIVECRRYTSSRLKQKDMGALAFTISDVGANGAIVVSPLDLQKGARIVAAHAGVVHVILRPDSTTTDYLLRYLNRVFAGISDTFGISIRESVVVEITHADGTKEIRRASDSASQVA